jgi:hypothetical protein
MIDLILGQNILFWSCSEKMQVMIDLILGHMTVGNVLKN